MDDIVEDQINFTILTLELERFRVLGKNWQREELWRCILNLAFFLLGYPPYEYLEKR